MPIGEESQHLLTKSAKTDGTDKLGPQSATPDCSIVQPVLDQLTARCIQGEHHLPRLVNRMDQPRRQLNRPDGSRRKVMDREIAGRSGAGGADFPGDDEAADHDKVSW